MQRMMAMCDTKKSSYPGNKYEEQGIKLQESCIKKNKIQQCNIYKNIAPIKPHETYPID